MKFYPERASTMAGQVDALYGCLVGVCALFAAVIVACLVAFSVKYRRRSPGERAVQTATNNALEVIWIAIPGVILLGMFAWGASLFVDLQTPPAGAMEVYVIGRRWMWKVQHPSGAREINELHVPTGRPVRLHLTSQDVIHSFYVPAFRIKQDALPGRYTTAWFEATRPGEYRLFCAEYCGTLHSGMVGRVAVLEPRRYEEWLERGAEGSPAAEGRRLFLSLGCATCHTGGPEARAPRLEGLFGSRVPLRGGGTATADAAYVRESILDPAARVVEGFEPIMPSFRGRVGEEEILALIEYIRSLGAAPEGPPAD
ncbi:MAG TPA: cytochrome c oxidase subunit II [Planctomycetota bacterium]|nr:cytochrome c oxidase subunit II [Planctomycetota bacterium]